MRRAHWCRSREAAVHRPGSFLPMTELHGMLRLNKQKNRRERGFLRRDFLASNLRMIRAAPIHFVSKAGATRLESMVGSEWLMETRASCFISSCQPYAGGSLESEWGSPATADVSML